MTESSKSTSSPNQKRGFRVRFWRRKKSSAPVPNALQLNKYQQRALIITVIIALVAGFFLIRGFFGVIVLSVMGSVLFYPVYKRLNRRIGRPGTAAMITAFIALFSVIIPLVIVIVITITQIQHLLSQLEHISVSTATITEASGHLLDAINRVLSAITRGSYQITAEQLQSSIARLATDLASFFLNLITNSFSSIASLITELILFFYLFTSMLTNADTILGTIRALNPLGDEASELYVSRTGEMIKAVVGGQFVIAFCQGVTEAGILYLAGVHYFAFFALILSFLSVIPLGGGIVAIPIGIIMILTGNIWQGAVILLGHFLIITNIDNFLRPKLIPKSIRMNSALMMLAVFGGLGIFGFLGIFIGPVIMILVTSTVQFYIPLAEADKKTG